MSQQIQKLPSTAPVAVNPMRIDRLRCRFKVRRARATEFHQRCSNMRERLRQRLAVVLGQAQSRFHGHLVIDRLELKLGTIPAARFEERFIELAVEALVRRLAAWLASSHLLPAHDQLLHVDHTGQLTLMESSWSLFAARGIESSPGELKGDQEVEYQAKLGKGSLSVEPAVGELQHYLKTGDLPKSWRVASDADAELRQLLAAGGPVLIETLARACLVDSQQQRLLRTLQPATLQALASHLAAIPLAIWPQSGAAVWPLGLSLAALLYFQRSHELTPPPWDSDLLARWQEGAATQCFVRWQTALRERLPSTPPAWRPWVKSILQPLAAAETPALTRSSYRDAGGPLQAISTDELEVCNAGIVLLWPFLPGLLMECGLLAAVEGVPGGMSFVDAGASHAAVCLLDHLVWGEPRPEVESGKLNKLLCAVPLEQPINSQGLKHSMAVSAFERCFKQLLAQWPALASLTPQDLRVLFLQRPGYLHATNHGWRLQVKSDACDILLAEAPWPMHTLYLPWLSSPLSIEWLPLTH